ncbi:LLM class flavin-dependent oxidoreductase [Kineococcus rhizosphaerae]|uniref:Alkanesulfonate monooxygenase SsuD/methylene tetrahydromethanopterin reductase-like flavin-dependent oxidoreductase (Luciferase family) n=1 Tax=Kineococcus rhizosphaerae TaxID=559628 RepID=A0A2T0QY21_9ACTN|nr:LLM class flavin-dependent oxidoreductase [Kineococcus rhizosphaerae]PRY11103.1 alkanesulfonate monooxygenase SsuD/methylene tetrahydromethanopterin reductase-like flavin-dependent oxidoreductase (luciferase family) [Kineococcus rhizosphaerae]
MRIDTNLLGAVAMPDAGIDGPPTTSRRYGRQDYANAFADFVAYAKTADETGFDTLWYTEHHFQHEGYEVIPNQVLLGLYSAALTQRVNFGQMFNIVPQWNPLRLAEDFATADVLTGGRMRFGVGRGTVPREMQTLGARIESGDNGMDADAENANREVFAEAMEVIKLAFEQDRFSYSGKHFTYPPTGIPDRGGVVTDLALVPNVLRPVEVYQACTSPRTVQYVAEQGHVGVYTRQSIPSLRTAWERHAEHAAAAGRDPQRMLVLHAHVGRTREEALERVRPAHDELAKLLSPYGRFSYYDAPEGTDSVPFDFCPTLEESARQHIYAVGTPDDVAESIDAYREALGLDLLSLSLDGPGLSREVVQEQMHLVSSEVAPRLGIRMVP